MGIDKLLSHTKELADDDANQELIAILYSSLDLMIYNQVESTASSCFEAIYDHLQDERILFDALIPNFQKKILSDVLSTYTAGKTLHDRINGEKLSQVISQLSFKGEKFFSGNVDKKKLNAISGQYGLNFTTPANANNGDDLVTIKTTRNRLAHGLISFSRHGASSTYTDVEGRVKNARAFMRALVSQIEEYLINKRYLAPLDVVAD